VRRPAGFRTPFGPRAEITSLEAVSTRLEGAQARAEPLQPASAGMCGPFDVWRVWFGAIKAL